MKKQSNGRELDFSDNVIAIVQARMGSKRLPGKSLMHVNGQPLLWHVLARIQQARSIVRVVVATTNSASDDAIAAFCEGIGVLCYRGSEDDVLDRYYRAAKMLRATTIVRITGDCPLIDPAVIDSVVRRYFNSRCDYVSNVNPPTFPDGLDTEVFSFRTLETAWNVARLKSDREHVTPFIRRRTDLFRIDNVTNDVDLSHLRWTVDEFPDLTLVRTLAASIGQRSFHMEDILALLESQPALSSVNASIQRNEGYAASLRSEAAAIGSGQDTAASAANLKASGRKVNASTSAVGQNKAVVKSVRRAAVRKEAAA